mgnify:FL=1
MKETGKRETIRKYASAEGDELLLARIFDKYSACRSRNYIQSSRFLSLHERLTAERAIAGEKLEPCLIWGGYEGAERRLIIFYPDYMDEESARDECGISVIRAWYRAGTVDHRDMLGSLMNIGITRECIGDLLIHDEFCDILCLDESVEFIMNNLTRAGREALRPERLDAPPAAAEEKVKIIKDTMASERLDAIVSSGCSISRGNAANLISAGRVKLNDMECTRQDRLVTEGDVISVRGYGKMILQTIGGLSRKGRRIIEIKKFL